MYSLKQLGWNKEWEKQFQPYKEKKYIPARISQDLKNYYSILMEEGEKTAHLAEKIRDYALNRTEFPAVGDWVAVEQSKKDGRLRIVAILPRKNRLSRKAKNTFGRNFEKAGSSDEQVLSANIDVVFLIISLNLDYNLRKIERYYSMILESKAQAVILLNKIDLCPDYEEKIQEVKKIVFRTPVHGICASEGLGIDLIQGYIKPGNTISIIGSSGVGKSTLINQIVGEDKLITQEIRTADGRGRHTTTRREMVILPTGGILIDNPGMRDIKIVATEESIKKTFKDIIALEKKCYFRNCSHDTEPNCAVKEAIEKGKLDEERLESYKKLSSEREVLSKRQKERKKYEDGIRSTHDKFGNKLRR